MKGLGGEGGGSIKNCKDCNCACLTETDEEKQTDSSSAESVDGWYQRKKPAARWSRKNSKLICFISQTSS